MRQEERINLGCPLYSPPFIRARVRTVPLILPGILNHGRAMNPKAMIAVLFAISGCQFTSNDRWQRVGTYLPDRLSSKEINAVLEPAKVSWTSEGSRAYELEVAPRDAARATRILKASEIASRIQFSN